MITRLAIRMTATGAALYALLFIAAGAMRQSIGSEIYERLNMADSWTPMLAIAGALLFTGVILAEIVFQIRRSGASTGGEA